MSPEVLVLADETQTIMIKEKIGETEEKLKNRMELMKEYILMQDYLPKDFGERFIENWIRVSKFDILKARKKLETYLYAKYSWTNFFHYTRLLNHDVFKFPIHRRSILSKRLTKEGCRMFVARFNSEDAPYVCVDNLLSYTYLLGEYMMRTDFSSGIIFILDSHDFYTEFLANTNMKTFKMCMDVFVRVMPYRIKSIHFCGLNAASKILVNIIVAMLPEKTRKKVVFHKSTATLTDYIDVDDLPKELGGKGDSLDEVGEEFRKFFMSNRQLVQDITDCKLLGPLPKERRRQIGEFDNPSLDGSFRKLDID